MAIPRFNYTKHTHTPKTQNFASICAEIASSGKSYAEWQKEQYRTLYDVRTGIKERIKKL